MVEWLKRPVADALRLKRGGHLTVRLGSNVTSLPMHGAGKEIGKGLEHHIKKVLGLK